MEEAAEVCSLEMEVEEEVASFLSWRCEKLSSPRSLQEKQISPPRIGRRCFHHKRVRINDLEDRRTYRDWQTSHEVVLVAGFVVASWSESRLEFDSSCELMEVRCLE